MTDNDQPIDSEINYDEVETGTISTHKITTELYTSHCTSPESLKDKEKQQFYFVSKLFDELESEQNLSVFFDRKHMTIDPFDVMNRYLDRSRNLLAVCTPAYIDKVMRKTGSYPSQELASFHAFEVSSEKRRIIPLLIDITIKEFQQQGSGIPLINHNKMIVVSPDYVIPEKTVDIVKKTAMQIVDLHNELLKQW